LPNTDDILPDKFCDGMVGAELLDCLPVPERSLAATMPWKRNGGMLKHEKKWKRALLASPLLLMVYGCALTMGVAVMRLSMTKGGERITMGDGVEAGLWTRYFRLKGLDSFIELYVAFFTPALSGLDPVGRLQLIAFLADIVPVVVIWKIEANRRGNVANIANLM